VRTQGYELTEAEFGQEPTYQASWQSSERRTQGSPGDQAHRTRV
jgi:hypothetical protein